MPVRAQAPYFLACGFKAIHAQVFYDFGLANVIRKLFADPEWAAARGMGRDTSAAMNFMAALLSNPAALRLLGLIEGQMGSSTRRAAAPIS